MQLVLVRHAIAEEAAGNRRGDAGRRLTRDGRSRMRLGARGLATFVGKVDIVGSSPYVRAMETARIVARAIGSSPLEEVAALAPGGRAEDVCRFLRERRPSAAVLVGHEPGLSQLVGFFLTGKESSLFTLKKGGACGLELRSPRKGAARLEWLATGRMLRDLGGSP